MKRMGLRNRITLIVALVALAVLAFFALAAGGAVDEEFTSEALVSTAEQLDELERRLADDLDVAAEELAGGLDPANLPFFMLFDASGEPLQDLSLNSDSEGLTRLARTSCRSASGGVSCDVEVTAAVETTAVDISQQLATERAEAGDLGAVPIVVVADFVRIGDTEVTILVERDIFSSSDGSAVVSDGLALSIAAVLSVVMALAAWLALGRALRPVEAMTAQVQRIGENNLHERVPVPGTNDELNELATTMNGMLDRLESSRDTQLQFISDASHELRSPITATQATLEVARTHPESADWEQVASVLSEENDRLAHLVDDLLVLARLDESAGDTVLSAVDLDEMVLAEAARPHPADIRVIISRPARVEGNMAMLTRAIRNLVQNAARHASAEVVVEVGVLDGGAAFVRVDDDGPGIPAEFRQAVFGRFNRLDEARNRDDGGAGLGLAIVKKVVESHGGSVAASESNGGGASLLVTLPAAK